MNNLEYKCEVDGHRITWRAKTTPKPDGSWLEVIHTARLEYTDLSGSQIILHRGANCMHYIRDWTRYGDVKLIPFWRGSPNHHLRWTLGIAPSEGVDAWYWILSARAQIRVHWDYATNKITRAEYARNAFGVMFLPNARAATHRESRIQGLVKEIRFWNWRRQARKFIPWFRQFKPRQRQEVITRINDWVLPEIVPLITRLL